MSLIRLFFTFVVFYLFYKAVKILVRVFMNGNKSNKEQYMNTNYKKESKSKIDKRDIVEADFEEIDKS